MITITEVETYLKELKMKIDIFGLAFINSHKNQQTLNDLEISPSVRKEVINSLIAKDYFEGPLEEKMRGLLPMWVFGKKIKKEEVFNTQKTTSSIFDKKRSKTRLSTFLKSRSLLQ